jgi:hypothetical protein
MTATTDQQPPVEIVATRGPRAGLVNVEARRGGVTVATRTFHKDHAENRVKFAAKVGVSDEAVADAIRKALEAEPGPLAALLAPAPVPFSVTLRGMHQPKEEGRVIAGETPLAALQAGLNVTDLAAAEPVLEWNDPHQLALLDLDRHDLSLDRRPGAHQLQALAGRGQTAAGPLVGHARPRASPRLRRPGRVPGRRAGRLRGPEPAVPGPGGGRGDPVPDPAPRLPPAGLPAGRPGHGRHADRRHGGDGQLDG